MSFKSKRSTFVATPEKGKVSSMFIRPKDAVGLLLLGHGFGATMDHPTMEAIAQAMAKVGVATFRYQFPYKENGKGRDSLAVSLATVQSAVLAAQKAAPDLPMVAGGRSFSARMTSMSHADTPLKSVNGFVFFAFPLHAPGKPSTERADHLDQVDLPMLFLTGTRDTFAKPDLLTSVIKRLKKRATLHWLDTADHGYKILKRTRDENAEDVFDEMARITLDWLKQLS